MAKPSKKSLEVQKFGGTEKLGEVEMHGYSHEIDTIETESNTKIEEDRGEGGAAIIRRFTFGVNPEAFNKRPPTKQELFNSHIRGIEIMLWRDGMTLMTEVEPRITFEKNQYHIFVGAKPQRGHILQEKPKTLSQVVHG